MNPAAVLYDMHVLFKLSDIAMWASRTFPATWPFVADDFPEAPKQ
jgi:hypothetical protein